MSQTQRFDVLWETISGLVADEISKLTDRLRFAVPNISDAKYFTLTSLIVKKSKGKLNINITKGRNADTYSVMGPLKSFVEPTPEMPDCFMTHRSEKYIRGKFQRLQRDGEAVAAYQEVILTRSRYGNTMFSWDKEFKQIEDSAMAGIDVELKNITERKVPTDCMEFIKNLSLKNVKFSENTKKSFYIIDYVMYADVTVIEQEYVRHHMPKLRQLKLVEKQRYESSDVYSNYPNGIPVAFCYKKFEIKDGTISRPDSNKMTILSKTHGIYEISPDLRNNFKDNVEDLQDEYHNIAGNVMMTDTEPVKDHKNEYNISDINQGKAMSVGDKAIQKSDKEATCSCCIIL